MEQVSTPAAVVTCDANLADIVVALAPPGGSNEKAVAPLHAETVAALSPHLARAWKTYWVTGSE